MLVSLNTEPLQTLNALRCFLEGSGAVEFTAPAGTGQRDWIARTLHGFHYRTLDRVNRGPVLWRSCAR